MCRAQQGCNVFVFCPSFEGCAVAEVPFPAFGCQLKYLANLSSDPTAFPAASERGPPTSFDSGERTRLPRKDPLWLCINLGFRIHRLGFTDSISFHAQTCSGFIWRNLLTDLLAYLSRL